VIVIFIIGPLLSLIMAVLARRSLLKNRFKLYQSKLFYAWLTLFGYTFFFGSVITGVLTRTEAMYATTWIFMSDMFDIKEASVVFISISCMLILGSYLNRVFIYSMGSPFFIRTANRPFSLYAAIVLPWFISLMLLALVSAPYFYIPYLLKNLSSGILMVPLIFTFRTAKVEIEV
jgi:hypothetical protein